MVLGRDELPHGDDAAEPDDRHNWHGAVLGDVVCLVSGGTPSKKQEAYWNGAIPWVSAKDMRQFRLRDTVDHVTSEGLASGTRQVPAGTVLLLTRGMRLLKELPICVIERPMAFNQDIKAILPNAQIDPRFLPYLILGNEQRVRNLVDLAGHGTGRINSDELRALEVRWPPVHEQRVIVAVLMDVDALIGSLEALIEKKRAIKQAAMQQLLTGRTRLPGFDGEWDTRRIGELAEVDPENLSASTPPDFSFNYISIDDVDAGRLAGYTKESFQTAPSRARRVVRAGDVLMSTVRPALRGHLFFDGRLRNAVCSTGFAVLRAKRDWCEPHFLSAHLFGDVVDAQLQALLVGSNYPAINGTDVRGLRVTCPPTLEEQQAIASILSDMDAEITALERRLAKTRAVKQGMMQQLLTGAVRLPIPGGLEGESHDA